jgi:hypothetical protein
LRWRAIDGCSRSLYEQSGLKDCGAITTHPLPAVATSHRKQLLFLVKLVILQQLIKFKNLAGSLHIGYV